MKSPKVKGIGEVITEYGAKVMKVFKKGLLGRSLFDFYGDVKADTFRTKENSIVPGTPADGKGGVVYTKSSDGKLYYKSNEVSEVDLTTHASGTVTSVGTTGTVNGLTLTGTVTSSGNLTLGGTLAVDISSDTNLVAGTNCTLSGDTLNVDDAFLKNDAADTIAGDLTVDSDFLYIKDQSGSGAASRLTTATLTGNKTLTLPDASGTLALINYQRHILHCGFNGSYTGSMYLPFGYGGTFEYTSSTNNLEFFGFVCPADGYVESVVMRSENVCGSSTVGIHVAAAGTEVPSAGLASFISTAVDMAVDDTAYKFNGFENFGGSSNSFSAGDVIMISFDPTSDADDTTSTAVLVLDWTNAL